MAGKETVKGTFGNEPIELNNAATETTLTAMLKLAQKDSVVLAEMAKKAGVNEKNMKESLDKAQQGGGSGSGSGGGVGLLGGAAKLAGGVLGDMAGMAMSVVGSLGNFVGALANGTTKASELAMAFKDLPLGLGTFAGILSFANKIMEENMETYRAMSNSGAGLVGTIGNLKIEATALGLTLGEYGSLFGKNSDVMIRLGGTMAQGSKNLIEMNKSFVGSNMGQKILQLGFSYDELNNLIPNYIRSTGDSIDRSKSFESEMIRLQTISAKYAEDLDYVARITGENREELQRKKQEMMAEAGFQLWYLKQPAANKKVIDEILNRNLVSGGQAFVDATKASLQGFAGAFTPEGKAINSYFGDANRVIAEQKKLITSGLPDEERRQVLNKLQVRSIQGFAKNIDELAPTIYALSGQNKLGATGMKELIEKTNKWRTAEGGRLESTETMMADIEKISEGQRTDSQKTIKQLAKEKETRDASVKIQQALNPLMEELSNITLTLIKEFTKVLNENMPKIKTALGDVVDFIKLAFKNPEAVISQIKGYMQELMAWFFEGLASGPVGQYLFGDAAKSMKERAQLNAALAIDAERYAALKKMEKDQTLKGRDAEELARYRETYRNAAGVVASRIQDKAANISSATGPFTDAKAMAREDYHKKFGKDANELLGENWILTREKEIAKELEAKKLEMAREAEAIRKGGYTYEGVPALIKKLDNLTGRASGSPDGKVEDWGRESLVKLHGKEAVLTEEQLAAMNNKPVSGNTAIELADLKIVAEGIITLNRQAAMQNKILGQMADNQMTMLRRSSGNRLMA